MKMTHEQIKKSWAGHLAKQTAKRHTKRKMARATKQKQRNK